jgi:tetratricopeptide (TPR) repeat protein
MNSELHVEELKNNTGLCGALESGNNDEAIRILAEIVQRDETHKPAFNLLSQCYLNKNEYFPALKCLKRCRELKTTSIKVYRNLGKLYDKLYVLDPARQIMQFLSENEESADEETFINYASVLVKMGRDDEAIEYLEKKCAENPESDVLDGALVIYYLITDENKPSKVEKAKDVIEKLARKGSPLAEELKKGLESYNYEADLEENKQNKMKAQEHLLRAKGSEDLKTAMEEYWAALDCYSRLAIAYTYLGAIYDHMGFLEEGGFLHDYAIHLDPYLAIAHNNRGYVFDIIGNIEEAMKAYQKALELDPKLVVALNSLGVAYDNLGDFEKGISLFQRSLAIEPDRPSTLHNMAYPLKELGKYDEARKYYERTIQVAPKWIEPRLNLSGLYLSLDCPIEAEPHMLEVLKIEPDHLRAWIRLAHCYGRVGDGNRFAEAMKKVMSIKPSDPDDVFDMAELYERVDKPRALELWKFYLQVASRRRPDRKQIEYARKRIEQIEGTTM